MESSNELVAHLTSGAIVVYCLQFAKALGVVPWLTADSKSLNRIVSVVAALVIAVGITGHYDWNTGGDFHIPNGMGLVTGVYDWMKQIICQQMLYDGVIAKAMPTRIILEHALPSALPGGQP